MSTPTAQIPEATVNEQATELAISLASVMSKPIEQRIDEALAGIEPALQIRTHEEKAVAVAKVQALKFLRDGPTEERDSVKETFEEIQTAAHRLHKAICAIRGRFDERINAKIAVLNDAVTAWDVEQKRLQQQADEERRRQQDLDVRRARVNQLLAASAEQFKIDRAAVEKKLRGIALDAPSVKDVEQLEGFFRDQQRIAADKKAEAETAEAAAQARAIGDEELAKQIETGQLQAGAEMPAALPPPPPPPAPVLPIARTSAPTIKGSTLRGKVKLVIEDPTKIPIEYHNPFQDLFDPESWPKIKAVVRTMGLQTKIPGVRVEEESQTQIRKR